MVNEAYRSLGPVFLYGVVFDMRRYVNVRSLNNIPIELQMSVGTLRHIAEPTTES